MKPLRPVFFEKNAKFIFIMTSWIVGSVAALSCAEQEKDSVVSRRSTEEEIALQSGSRQQTQGQDIISSQNQSSKQGLPPSSQKDQVTDAQASQPSMIQGGAASKKPSEPPTQQVEEAPPIQYDSFFYPPKMKECHNLGKIYDRGTLDCHKTQIMGTVQNGFSCVKSGVLKAFGNAEGLEKNIDLKIALGWKLDQCGIDGVKKTIYFVCFADKNQQCSENPKCLDLKDLEPANTKFCVSKISES